MAGMFLNIENTSCYVQSCVKRQRFAINYVGMPLEGMLTLPAFAETYKTIKFRWLDAAKPPHEGRTDLDKGFSAKIYAAGGKTRQR